MYEFYQCSVLLNLFAGDQGKEMRGKILDSSPILFCFVLFWGRGEKIVPNYRVGSNYRKPSGFFASVTLGHACTVILQPKEAIETLGTFQQRT